MIERVIQAIRSLPRWGKIALLVSVLATIVLVIVFWEAIFPIIGLTVFGLVCLYDKKENDNLTAQAAQATYEQQLLGACHQIMYQVMSDPSLCRSFRTLPPSTISSMRVLNVGAYYGCPRYQYSYLRPHGSQDVTWDDLDLYRDAIQGYINQFLSGGCYAPPPVCFLGHIPSIWVCEVSTTNAEFKVDVALVTGEEAAIRVADAEHIHTSSVFDRDNMDEDF